MKKLGQSILRLNRLYKTSSSLTFFGNTRVQLKTFSLHHGSVVLNQKPGLSNKAIDTNPNLKPEKPSHLIQAPFHESILSKKISDAAKNAEEFWVLDNKDAIKYLEKKIVTFSEEIDESDEHYQVSIYKLKELLGTMFFSLGEYEKSKPLFEELRSFYLEQCEKIPTESLTKYEISDICVNLHDCYVATGNINEANQILEKSLELCENRSVLASTIIEKLSYNMLSISQDKRYDLSQKTDMLKEGIKLVSGAIEKDDTHCGLLYAKGIFLEELSKILPITRVEERENYLKEAVSCYDKILKIDPTEYHAEMNAGDCHSKLGNDQVALSFYNRFIDHFNLFVKDCVAKGNNIDFNAVYVDILVKLGIAYTKYEDHEMARSHFAYCMEYIDTCLKKNPANAQILKQYKVNALNKRGLSYFRKKEYWKCVNDNTEAINIDNTFFPAFRDRCEAYEALSQTELAKEDRTMAEYLKRKYVANVMF